MLNDNCWHKEWNVNTKAIFLLFPLKIAGKIIIAKI